MPGLVASNATFAVLPTQILHLPVALADLSPCHRPLGGDKTNSEYADITCSLAAVLAPDT
jgi:hypothetical protein